jgi:hypothetical protein
MLMVACAVAPDLGALATKLTLAEPPGSVVTLVVATILMVFCIYRRNAMASIEIE